MRCCLSSPTAGRAPAGREPRTGYLAMCDVAILQDGATPSLRSRRIGWWADALTERLLRRSCSFHPPSTSQGSMFRFVPKGYRTPDFVLRDFVCAFASKEPLSEAVSPSPSHSVHGSLTGSPP